MARFTSLMLLGFLGAGLVAASPKPFDQETQMRNAKCSVSLLRVVASIIDERKN